MNNMWYLLVYYRLSDFQSKRSALLTEPDQIFLQTSSGRQRSPIPRVGRWLKNISFHLFIGFIFWKQPFYLLSFYSLIRVVLHFMYYCGQKFLSTPGDKSTRLLPPCWTAGWWRRYDHSLFLSLNSLFVSIYVFLSVCLSVCLSLSLIASLI